jgi:hypothetical protein
VSLETRSRALRRARKTVDARLPEDSQQATLRTWATRRCARSSNEFVTAWEQADVDAVVAMLADGAALTMPPIPTWYQGRAAVAAFLVRVPLAGRSRWRLVPNRANGQPAFGTYNWDAERKGFVPHEILALTLDGAQIAEITRFPLHRAVRALRIAGRARSPAIGRARRSPCAGLTIHLPSFSSSPQPGPRRASAPCSGAGREVPGWRAPRAGPGRPRRRSAG